MFIDKVNTYLAAGRGGDGCISFRREKYVPYGGPDGGNGGNGGDIYFESDQHKTTLLDLSYRPKFKAEDGQKGSSGDKSGRYGEDLIIKIPLGTLIFKNGEFFADLKTVGERILIVKGGRGGRGNASFKTGRHTVPRIAEKGAPGETAEVNLELRLIADVGLLGLPNAGKSTLLSQISAAKPKIADYPFTTLAPNLGVVNYKGKHFTAADIPGIIEGAYKGIGLGFEFLRHIRRTKVLIHVIDVNGFDGRDPYENYKIINNELKKYSKHLAKKHVIIVLNKIDSAVSLEQIKNFKKHLKTKKLFETSAATGYGIDALLKEMLRMLEKPVAFSTEEEVEPLHVKKYIYEPEFKISIKNGIFVATGAKVETLTEVTKFDEEESLRRYHNILKKMGLEIELKKMGARPGDTVRIGDFEFTFEK
ncbi:GTPase ObgE [Candidatus Endomicrobiellum trichonymphae]|uniref:GTPase ObgE n=1 Tax=Endomicrobium trichonymphae TaxID=1408204 RepID=UPI000865A655|nr:GTPase ObgE [Candidatus Endomicrobium trichonymphae]BAV59080.1 conservede GTP-binding protein [Candidatus Endomicrobium trichonymphae]